MVEGWKLLKDHHSSNWLPLFVYKIIQIKCLFLNLRIAFRPYSATIQKFRTHKNGEKNVIFGPSNDLNRDPKILQHLLSINLTIYIGITNITAIRFIFG